VVGVDISETQIALAPKHIPNCSFRVGCATKLDFIESSSVDLFAAGLTFNLVPQAETLAEADRVLRPGKTLAIFGYGLSRATDKKLDDILQDTFKDIRQFAPRELLLMMDAYAGVELPYPDATRKDGFLVRHKFSLEGLMAGLQVVDHWMSQHAPERVTEGRILQDFKKAVVDAYPAVMAHPTRKDFELVSNVVVVMAHKPSTKRL
ncbi:methyltransferase Mb3374, partial [Elysia marginata]